MSVIGNTLIIANDVRRSIESISVKRRKVVEIGILVGTLTLSVAFFWFSGNREQKGESKGGNPEIHTDESVPWSFQGLDGPYLKGFYSENSFFQEGNDDYALLYNHRPVGVLWKVSLRGKLLHSWKAHDPSGEGVHLVEQHGDDFFAVVQVRRLEKYDRSGQSLWHKNIAAHHDLDIDDNGNIYLFDLKQKRVQVDGNQFPIFVDDLVVLDSKGNELKRTHLWPILSPLLTPAHKTKAREYYRLKQKIDDTFHLNSLDLLPHDIEGVGKKGDILISVRNLDLLVVLDSETSKVLWEYGPKELQHQHNAHFISNGDILVFDNGVYNEESRVLKIDPVKKRIIWRYEPRDKSFYTRRHGSAVELPNGNILVALGKAGRLYEVNKESRVVAFAKLRAPGIEQVNPYRLGYSER